MTFTRISSKTGSFRIRKVDWRIHRTADGNWRELGFRGIPILNAALAAISNERGEVIVPTGRIPHFMRDVGTKNQYFFAAPIFNCEHSIRDRRTVALSNQREPKADQRSRIFVEVPMKL